MFSYFYPVTNGSYSSVKMLYWMLSRFTQGTVWNIRIIIKFLLLKCED